MFVDMTDNPEALPLHDCTLVAIILAPNKMGLYDVEVVFNFFNEEELSGLRMSSASLSNMTEKASLRFVNADTISIGTHPVTAFEMLDIITVGERNEEGKHHVELRLISGAKIRCFAEKIGLSPIHE